MAGRCTVRTATLVGVEAVPVDVEVDVGQGLPSFAIVGLPDLAVQEAKERVRAAVRCAGYEVPNARIVVNLAPGPLRKHGTGFDLPIALGLLVATGQLPPRLVQDVMAVGELSLKGAVRPVPGMVAYAMTARDAGVSLLAPPLASLSLVDGVDLLPLADIGRLKAGIPRDVWPSMHIEEACGCDPDFSDVCGQGFAVRALTIAAAGGHNVLMVGPPGSGKTMLARRLPGVLPELSAQERIETALVHSVAGLPEQAALSGVRPFRAPHHSASVAGLVGGGSPARPGEASLAHNGVLFLDEMPEFGPAALQSLRQPMEDHSVTLVRADGRVRFPSRFTIVGAANPCPCGYLGDPVKPCTCSAASIDRYQSRIGGPLMDRMDITVRVERPDPSSITSCAGGQSSAYVRSQVISARARSTSRGQAPNTLTGSDLLRSCMLDEASLRLLETAATRHHLSGRAITRVLRLSRTIADIEGHDRVSAEHLWEALGYRHGASS